MSIARFVLCMLAALFLISATMSAFGFVATSEELDGNIWGTIILALFFAPIVETFGCQFMPIEASQAYLNNVCHRKCYGLSIVISALVFSAIHYYNWAYVIVTFFEGALLAFGFISQRGKGYVKSFAAIALVHFFWNLLATVFHFL